MINECPWCGKEFEYDMYGGETDCPECNKPITIGYDEHLTEDGDEIQHSWLEKNEVRMRENFD
jgi:hypothetical protein